MEDVTGRRDAEDGDGGSVVRGGELFYIATGQLCISMCIVAERVQTQTQTQGDAGQPQTQRARVCPAQTPDL